MTNERAYRRIALAVLAVCLILTGTELNGEVTCRLRSGGLDSGGGGSQSTSMLHSFMDQSTPIGKSQCPGTHLRGGIGYTVGIPGKVTAICGDVTLSPLQQTFALYPNVPNPFNPTTVIKYQLRDQGSVSLAVYNILGRRVKTLVDRTQQAGHYSTSWDGCDDSGKEVAAGVYLYRLQAGAFAQTRKMALVK